MCSPPRVRRPPWRGPWCCCSMIYIQPMAFSIGMLIHIYMARTRIETLFDKLSNLLGKVSHTPLLCIHPPTPHQSPFHPSSPPNTGFSNHLEKKGRKGREELRPTTAVIWESLRGFVHREDRRFSEDGCETESSCVILCRYSSLEISLFFLWKGY